MKRVLLIFAMISLLFACNSTESNTNNEENQNQTEVAAADSITTKMENIKNDIEETSKKLEEDLENL